MNVILANNQAEVLFSFDQSIFTRPFETIKTNEARVISARSAQNWMEQCHNYKWPFSRHRRTHVSHLKDLLSRKNALAERLIVDWRQKLRWISSMGVDFSPEWCLRHHSFRTHPQPTFNVHSIPLVLLHRTFKASVSN